MQLDGLLGELRDRGAEANDAAFEAAAMLDAAGIMVVWNRRLKTRAGTCYFNRQPPRRILDVPGGRWIVPAWQAVKIDLNPLLQGDAKALLETLLHEMAHAIAGKNAGHSWLWRAQAWKLGCSMKRCHEIPMLATLSRRRKR